MSDRPVERPGDTTPPAPDAAADDAGIPSDAAVLDRIEDGVAVLLVGPGEVEVQLPAALLPAGARDGDWFRLLVPDAELTARRRDELGARLEAIRRDRRGGRFGV